MADPITLGTLATVGMASSALGGVVSAVGSVLGGQAKSQMFQYQAGVADINQRIAKRNASYARYVGEFEAQRSGMKSRYETGQQKVIQSGRGLDVNFGSPAAVRESQESIGRQEQTTIRSSAARRAFGYDVEAEKQRTAASMYRKSAKNEEIAGYIGAAGSILGATSSVAGKWYEAGQYGMGGGGISTGASPDFPYEYG